MFDRDHKEVMETKLDDIGGYLFEIVDEIRKLRETVDTFLRIGELAASGEHEPE